MSAPELSEEAKKQQNFIHAQVGCLLAAWANTETLFLGITRELMRTPQNITEVVYFSMHSARDRMDLVRDLALVGLKEPLSTAVQKLVQRFRGVTSLRNELAHCEYMLTQGYLYSGTHHASIDNLARGKQIATTKPFDKARMNEIKNITQQIIVLNNEVREMIQTLKERTD